MPGNEQMLTKIAYKWLKFNMQARIIVAKTYGFLQTSTKNFLLT
jgi:hypothetical protein